MAQKFRVGLWIIIFVLFLCFSARSQQIKGKVISSDNSVELADVKIRDSANILITKSRINGAFELFKKGNYHFYKKGYKPKTVCVDADTLIIVQLHEEPIQLNEVVLISNQLDHQLKKTPSSVSMISKDQLNSNNQVNLAPVINQVAGVYMHNATLNTNRITIRGIGARNLFGTSKIRAYYQDIPLTNGSGETTIEDLELAGIGKIEILKGPTSSLYGAGLGGSIGMIPDMGTFDQKSSGVDYLIGSFGLHKLIVDANLGTNRQSAKLLYSNTQSEGFRENNQFNRQSISLNSHIFSQENNQIVILANLIDLKAQIPSSLNIDSYLNKPGSAAPAWARAKGYEKYTKLIIGLSWRHEFSENTRVMSSVFGNLINGYEARPFNMLDQNSNAIGFRSRVINSQLFFDRDLTWSAGVEIFKDFVSYKTFKNLYRDFPPNFGSVEGEILSNFNDHRSYINLFLNVKYVLSQKTTFEMGLNLNKTQYKLSDYFNDDEHDFSGDYGFQMIGSPRIGITHQLFEQVMLRSTISHGFSPPKLEETLLPDGLINTDIRPETGWNYEIGSRGVFVKGKLQYDLVFYRMDIANLLVARRTGDDQFIGLNAGKTDHRGMELSLNYSICENSLLSLYLINALSIHDYSFKEFVDGDADYSKNDLTGVPDKTFNSQMNLETKSGLFAHLNYQYVGSIPINDDNSVYAKPYQLVNTKVGWKKAFNDQIRLSIYAGINNVFDEKYASMLQINALSFGNAQPRYYYPGEPINYYLGTRFLYHF